MNDLITDIGEVTLSSEDRIREAEDLSLIHIWVFQRIFQREEEDSERALSWLWTRKEAVMKLDGRGLGLDPRCFSVLASRTQLDGREIALATQIVRGHFISIAYDLSGKG